MSEQEGTKRKAAYRFSIPVDIDMLKEVMFACPHDAPYGQTSSRWQEVGEHMRALLGPELSAGGCRKRHDDLMAAFKKETVKSMRASGTEEEYLEREQLLQDLSDMIESANDKRKSIQEEKDKKADRRESDGHLIREAALAGLKRKATAQDSLDESEDDDRSPSKKKESRGTTPLKEAVSAVVDFAAIMEASHKLMREDQEMQKEAHVLALRKLELDEQRFLLDKAEREARFAAEQVERQTQFEFMQGTVELLRALAQKM
ncbi:hypothetical protein H310_06933 [Aphanomyces invadans]|uniref:Myb-like domain-containing protein n=1 Tax=Aphanomyces invadans TaxID=157072 RepID=A0A024U570_9STRA|nr:hypothetical protein H310_06933 [Aphanomyces invadans]ETW01384.1 hypothetical protein H310_06933 [Aphanomyces invadans]|eukprot:XP_008870382.1 hypothetical protein H310_06933 [Aphanomyces invadans]